MTAQLIIQLHRYIGIPLSLLVVTWFASGIVMMYTRGMPALDAGQALALKSSIPLQEIRLSPADAYRRAGVDDRANTLSVETLLLRPVYRFDEGLTIFADNGEIFRGADEDVGRDIVATAFMLPSTRVRFEGALEEPDQWTITERRHLPMLKYSLDDAQSTEAYVTVGTGEIVLVTDRTSRLLAWIGAIPHWIYFTRLRTNQPAWYWTIVVLSGIGCLVTIMGLILMYTQFRRSSPFRLRDSIRYRGLTYWHYLTGTVFGLLALSWLFSGLLSMDPFDWNSEPGLAVDQVELNGGPPDISGLTADDFLAMATGSSLKRIDVLNVFGERRFIEHHTEDPDPRRLTGPAFVADSSEIDRERILIRLDQVADASVVAAALIDNYDSYYYDRDHEKPLPVLRVAFDDPQESWIYIDPATGRITGRTNRLARLDRWMFNGLHSLDFGFWYDKRPLWDIVVIFLSIGGLATSGIGLLLGAKRIRRWHVRRHTGL